MSFEENNKKLSEIIKKLEKENLGIEESTNLYEEGVKLAKDSYKILSESKGKVTILKEELDKLQIDDEEEE